MRRLVLAAVLAAGTFAAPPARADGGRPDAAHLAKAATEFDAGVVAFRKKDYERAAAHFEEADAAVPSPNALRQAIRARADASEGARAATLAAAALARYPNDAATAKIARDTIEKYEPILHKVNVRCTEPCVLDPRRRRDDPRARRGREELDRVPRSGQRDGLFDVHRCDGRHGGRARGARRGQGRRRGGPALRAAGEAGEEGGADATPGLARPPATPSKAEMPPDEAKAAERAEARGGQGDLAGVLRDRAGRDRRPRRGDRLERR